MFYYASLSRFLLPVRIVNVTNWIPSRFSILVSSLSVSCAGMLLPLVPTAALTHRFLAFIVLRSSLILLYPSLLIVIQFRSLSNFNSKWWTRIDLISGCFGCIVRIIKIDKGQRMIGLNWIREFLMDVTTCLIFCRGDGKLSTTLTEYITVNICLVSHSNCADYT